MFCLFLASLLSLHRWAAGPTMSISKHVLQKEEKLASKLCSAADIASCGTLLHCMRTQCRGSLPVPALGDAGSLGSGFTLFRLYRHLFCRLPLWVISWNLLWEILIVMGCQNANETSTVLRFLCVFLLLPGLLLSTSH